MSELPPFLERERLLYWKTLDDAEKRWMSAHSQAMYLNRLADDPAKSAEFDQKMKELLESFK